MSADNLQDLFPLSPLQPHRCSLAPSTVMMVPLQSRGDEKGIRGKKPPPPVESHLGRSLQSPLGREELAALPSGEMRVGSGMARGLQTPAWDSTVPLAPAPCPQPLLKLYCLKSNRAVRGGGSTSPLLGFQMVDHLPHYTLTLQLFRTTGLLYT